MTRDEVLAMTDEELRIKAAELMGWLCLFKQRADGGGPCGFPPDGWTDANGEREEAICELPDYPHDIAAAWELVDKMCEDGHDVEVTTCGRHATCEVNVTGSAERVAGGFVENGEHCALRAIARAFILAKDNKNDKE